MTTTLDAEGSVRLLARIFDRLPRLPDAACAGRGELFTSEHPGDLATAVAICAECPALTACRTWRDSLPRSRLPVGVLAGIVHQPRPPGRPKKGTPE